MSAGRGGWGGACLNASGTQLNASGTPGSPLSGCGEGGSGGGVSVPGPTNGERRRGGGSSRRTEERPWGGGGAGGAVRCWGVPVLLDREAGVVVKELAGGVKGLHGPGDGLTEDGSPWYIISEAALEKVYDRLCERLQHFLSSLDSSSPQSILRISSVYFSVKILTGIGTFTAGRMVLLIPAMTFVLRDLLKPEFEIFSRELPNVPGRARILSNLKNPWEDMVEPHRRGLEQFSRLVHKD